MEMGAPVLPVPVCPWAVMGVHLTFPQQVICNPQPTYIHVLSLLHTACLDTSTTPISGKSSYFCAHAVHIIVVHLSCGCLNCYIPRFPDPGFLLQRTFYLHCQYTYSTVTNPSAIINIRQHLQFCSMPFWQRETMREGLAVYSSWTDEGMQLK